MFFMKILQPAYLRYMDCNEIKVDLLLPECHIFLGGFISVRHPVLIGLVSAPGGGGGGGGWVCFISICVM
jgi:hypothetical protein